jgi:F0F1-type ATP synthase assembly protein I
MTNKTTENKERGVPENRAAMFSMVRAMADTTWRMFFPPVVLVPAGIWADLKWNTKPWLTLLGLVIGFSFSILLVRQQMRATQ